MTANLTAESAKHLDDLALVCLAHLEHEEAMLVESLQVMREIRMALVRRELDRLPQLLSQQSHAAHAATELRKHRALLRERIGEATGMPRENVTLSNLAARLAGHLRTRLLERQQKLLEIARELNLINQGNAALVRQSLELLQQLFDSLTGSGQSGPRYNAHGRIDSGDGGSTFQANC